MSRDMPSLKLYTNEPRVARASSVVARTEAWKATINGSGIVFVVCVCVFVNTEHAADGALFSIRTHNRTCIRIEQCTDTDIQLCKGLVFINTYMKGIL